MSNILFWDILQTTIESSQKRMTVKSTFTRDYEAFLEVLIAARKRQGLTQQAVADLLDKPQSFVSKYESGERRLDVVEFCQIAKAIKEDPVALLREMGLV